MRKFNTRGGFTAHAHYSLKKFLIHPISMKPRDFLRRVEILEMRAPGFALAEAIIAIALIGGLTLLVAQMITLSNTGNNYGVLLGTRNQLVAVFRQAASDPNAIITSLQKKDPNGNRYNQVLYDCVCGGAGSNCETFKSDTLPPTLVMFDSSGSPLSSLSGQTWGYYDAAGNATNFIANAAFTLTATVIAECAPDIKDGIFDPPPACHGQSAEFIGVRYTIARYPSTVTDLKPLQGTLFINVNQIGATGSSCL
ncbi:MAG: hypothetical protein C5B49_02480 [Bdellovibrio sp.]|nr:MAG: hypothetical protein C5B49_02480 [Bdellovibrio sp.]